MVRKLATKLTFVVGENRWFSLWIYKAHDVDLANPVTYSDVNKALGNFLTRPNPFEDGETVLTLSPVLNRNRDFRPGLPNVIQNIYVFSKTFDEFYDEEQPFNRERDLEFFRILRILISEFACLLNPNFRAFYYNCYYPRDVREDALQLFTRHTWHFPIKPELMRQLTPSIAANFPTGEVYVPAGSMFPVENNDFYVHRLMICYALHIFISTTNQNSIYRAERLRLTLHQTTYLHEVIAAQARIQALKTNKWLDKDIHSSTPYEASIIKAQIDRYRVDHPYIAQGYGDPKEDSDDYYMEPTPRVAMSEREAFDRLCVTDTDFLDRVLNFAFKTIQDSKQLRYSFV